MLKLYDDIYHAKSENEALDSVSNSTGFNREDFKCEVVKEPVKIGLFKKEPGEYHCWYEYDNFDSDKKIDVVDASIYFDTTRKKILVTRYGFKSYEIDYSDLVDYEIVVASNNKTFTVGNKNKALKGAILFGAVGAIVGASDSKTESETVEFAEIIIRLRFSGKDAFEILTCNNRIATEDSEWRDALDQSKIVAEYLYGIIGV